MPTLKYDSDQWERNDVKRRQLVQDGRGKCFPWAEFLEDGTIVWSHKVYPYEFFWYYEGLTTGFKRRRLFN